VLAEADAFISVQSSAGFNPLPIIGGIRWGFAYEPSPDSGLRKPWCWTISIPDMGKPPPDALRRQPKDGYQPGKKGHPPLPSFFHFSQFFCLGKENRLRLPLSSRRQQRARTAGCWNHKDLCNVAWKIGIFCTKNRNLLPLKTPLKAG
jgi:hypothetical protein